MVIGYFIVLNALDVREITADSVAPDEYCPELYLSQWFREELKEEVAVYMINRTGCKPVHGAYQALVKHLQADTIVLVDGGTDSLMRGDEDKLGSPHEDMCSIGAVDMLKEVEQSKKFLCCIGFGVDYHHGVSHYLFLENVANLIREGAFYGTWSVLKEMAESKLYQSACKFSFGRMQTSIVSGSISAAIDGKYGNVQFTHRTAGSKLWINPLMSMYWCFGLPGLAKSIHPLNDVKETTDYRELTHAIYGKRNSKEIRASTTMPV